MKGKIYRAAEGFAKRTISTWLGVIGLPLFFFAILATIFLFIMSVFFSMPTEGAISAVTKNPQDDKYIQEYKKLASQYDVYIDGQKRNDVKEPIDYYGNDAQHLPGWGMIHSLVLFKSIKENLKYEEIPYALKKELAEEVRPAFYYRTSKRIMEYEVEEIDENGNKKTEKKTETTTVFLLEKADTIDGIYEYSYRWKQVDTGNAVIKYEELEGVKFSPTDRLDRIVLGKLGVPPDELETVKTMIIAAGIGFTEQREVGEFLLDAGVLEKGFSSKVPPEIMQFFKEAEKTYNIPWWFLAGIAYVESNFNPLAENPRTACFGLMQVSPSNWQAYAPVLGFDAVKDKANPRAQVMVGAYILKSYITDNVDWEGNWKESTLSALSRYGGYGTNIYAARGYAEKVWKMAEAFRASGQYISNMWPVEGKITSDFGYRIHPVTGALSMHNGIDIAVPTGTPVRSVSSGIASVGYDALLGIHIRVKDASFEYLYAHLSAALVKDGDVVEPGQVIGLSGNTGRSTGPHLHFGVKDLAKGVWRDPLTVLLK